jgi:hypothetical protein
MELKSVFWWRGKLAGYVGECPSGSTVIIPSPTLTPKEAEELLTVMKNGIPGGTVYRDISPIDLEIAVENAIKDADKRN